jgi:uncharacterized protein (TIGR02246 family)
MRPQSAVAALCLLLSVGCDRLQSPSTRRASGLEEKAAVQAATAAFHQALRTDDLEAFMSHVSDDVVFMPPGEPAVRGKSGVRTWYTAFLSQYHTSLLRLADQEVLVGDGWAVETGTYEWGLTPASGGMAAVDRGNYMQVWKQQPDGQWRFAREVYNSSLPAAPPSTQ